MPSKQAYVHTTEEKLFFKKKMSLFETLNIFKYFSNISYLRYILKDMEQTEDTNRISQDSNWMERFYNTKKQTEQQPARLSENMDG